MKLPGGDALHTTVLATRHTKMVAAEISKQAWLYLTPVCGCQPLPGSHAMLCRWVGGAHPWLIRGRETAEGRPDASGGMRVGIKGF